MTFWDRRIFLALAVLLVGFHEAGCGDGSPGGGGSEASPLPSRDGGMPDVPDEDEHEDETTMGRLFVASASGGMVKVVDLDEGRVRADALDFGGPARLLAWDKGRHVYGAVASTNRVVVADSGVEIESHGDHHHVHFHPPRLLGARLEGMGLGHVVLYGNPARPESFYLTAFFNGSGEAHILQARSLSASSPNLIRVSTGGPHRGFGIVALGHVFVTRPPSVAGGEVRGITIRSISMPAEVREMSKECINPKSVAANFHGVAFACQEGILCNHRHGSHFHSELEAYPSGMPAVEELKSVHLDGFEYFYGQNERGIVRFDPRDGRREIRQIFMGQVLDFGIDAKAQFLVVLTSDGKVHRRSASSGDPMGEPIMVLSSAWSGDGAKPSIVIAAKRVFVADPRTTKVIEVELERWRRGREFDVGISPASVAVAGVAPNFEEGHDNP
ncbi:MAG: hypothetical protein NZM37_06410 [Sandaracinaceae bacterium]|nr:hypothetical protein [Sandaracinaceae bacterium]